MLQRGLYCAVVLLCDQHNCRFAALMPLPPSRQGRQHTNMASSRLFSVVCQVLTASNSCVSGNCVLAIIYLCFVCMRLCKQSGGVALFSPSSVWESSLTGPRLHLLVLRAAAAL